MMYSKDNPKHLQAASVRKINYTQVEVTTSYGKRFFGSRMWADTYVERNESFILVQDEQGDWLRICFYDKDVIE